VNTATTTKTTGTQWMAFLAAGERNSTPMPTCTTEKMTVGEREQLILENMPQVKLIARKIHDRVPGNISLDDLISTGVVGLISAIDRYDPTQGVKLKTYAEYKIRGAILDSLRQMDWAPRQQRKRARLIESAINQLEQSQRREPTEEELSEFLGIGTDEYREWVNEAHSLSMGSLDMAWDEPGSEPMNHISDLEQHWPSRLLEKAELHRLLVRAVDRLPNPERTVLSLYYLEELTLREISTVMEIHESRVSQLKSQGISRLRAYLDRCWPDRGQTVRTR
jgi:RNA polymerase sigma factor for flagellar operon FliA